MASQSSYYQYSQNDPNLFLRPGIKGEFNDRSLDNSGYGALPAVEQNQTYLAYFESVGGTGPEIIGQTAYFIKYLIDTQGNVTTPEAENTSLYNLISNFELGKNALVKLIDNDPLATANPNDDTLTGLHSITGIGTIKPILYTETGSGVPDYVTTMSFQWSSGQDVVGNAENFAMEINKTSSQNQSNLTLDTPVAITFQQVVTAPLVSNLIFDNNITASFVKGEITGDTKIKLEFYLATTLTFTVNSPTSKTKIDLKKNGTIIGTFFIQGSSIVFGNFLYNAQVDSYVDYLDTNISAIVSTTPPNPSYFSNFTPPTLPAYAFISADLNYPIVDGDKFTLEATRNQGDIGIFGGYVKTYQEYLPGNIFIEGLSGITQGSYYWSSGSNSNVGFTWLTSSNALSAFYGGEYKQLSPTASLNFGLSEISTQFQIIPGDVFRFEYSQNNYFKVMEVDDETNPVKFKVFPKIPTGINLNHFVLYRLADDGKYIILDVDKLISGNSFTGIIQPEYISQELSDNYNNIIQDLTQKGIIS